MAEPELGNAGLIRTELYKADPDAENADEGLEQLTTGKNAFPYSSRGLLAFLIACLISNKNFHGYRAEARARPAIQTASQPAGACTKT
jgi:hypothetical protein